MTALFAMTPDPSLHPTHASLRLSPAGDLTLACKCRSRRIWHRRPPWFERPSDDPWNQLTPEDGEWLEQMGREGRLPNLTREEVFAEIEADRQRFLDRIRRAGFDPDTLLGLSNEK